MIGLQNDFRWFSNGIHCLRLSTTRGLLFAVICALLLGGCASAPEPQAQAGAGADSAFSASAAAAGTVGSATAETVQQTVTTSGVSQVDAVVPTVAAPQTRGDIPDVGNPAGIQLYAETEDGIFLLVADHAFPSRRGWAGFGGAADPGETIAQTAARETEEETRGVFKREALLAAIAGQEPLFDDKFAFYFVKVDMIPAEEINTHPTSGGLAFAERGPYAWVPYAEVERYLDRRVNPAYRGCVIDAQYLPDPKPNTNWFWPVWLNNFRVARLYGAIPF